MTTRSRIEQRDHLMTSLGMLADPIRRLIADWPNSRTSLPFVRSQFGKDYAVFIQSLDQFCRPENYFFEIELKTCRRTLYSLNDVFTVLTRNTPAEADGTFAVTLANSQAAIRAIPCDDPGTILPSDSPFQTYLRLRAVCAGASTRLDILDPWLTADVFHRYVVDVSPGAMLQVVTHDKVMSGSDPARRDRIVAVSELVARERKDKYRFLVTGQQHDRHCRADNEILHLGGSVAHAAMFAPYTLSRLDPVQSNHAFLDGVIAGAAEWYGPTVMAHRRV